MATACTGEGKSQRNKCLFVPTFSFKSKLSAILVQSCAELGVLWSPVNGQLLKHILMSLISLTGTFVQSAGLVFKTKFLHSPRVVNRLLFFTLLSLLCCFNHRILSDVSLGLQCEVWPQNAQAAAVQSLQSCTQIDFPALIPVWRWLWWNPCYTRY